MSDIKDDQLVWNQKSQPFHSQMTSKKPEMDIKTKSVLKVHDGMICGVLYKNGFAAGAKKIMPDIKDVKIIESVQKTKRESGNIDDEVAPIQRKVIKVIFADGSIETAILAPDDTYSLEQGISICITKKLLSDIGVHGSSLYNKIIKRAGKVMTQNRQAEADAQARQKASAERYQKHIEKQRKKDEKRAADNRQFMVDLISDAIIAAYQKQNSESVEQ